MRRTHHLDFSIAGDEQEQSRIQLEHNLQHTDLSLHLSSAHDDYSIEYPRHLAEPLPSFSAFAPLDHSREDFDPEEGLSHLHAWSYRDDEDGINPYGGETMSTAAHHASALTISAGLGGRGARRDLSLSGAEYDPDRPLQDLVANIDSKFSLMDGDNNARSLHASRSYNPLADSTADSNHVLTSQPTRGTAARLRSPRSANSSATSSSEPDTPDPTSSRPKLSDALSHLTFSPKRPRSPHLSIRSASPALSYTYSHRSRSSNAQPVEEHHLPPPSKSPFYSREHNEQLGGQPTPKPKKSRIASSRPASGPEIALRPPTPSTANSRFTKLARGLAHELEIEQSRWHAPDTNGGVFAQSTVRVKPKPAPGASRPPFVNARGTNKSGVVQLPDVTGLTSAVESPAKAGLRYLGYENDEKADTHLLETLSQVQRKLAHLDAENNTSRKRMRELERELEACRQEVAHERERVQERENAIARQQREAESSNRKGKEKARNDGLEGQRRYKEAVDEKKALEALISTLRSHMSRLSTELASHQSVLDELRSLREADSQTLREKVQEVDRLRTEVEKVAGEVEVLKGVVEEGLRERRNRQERSQLSVSEPDLHRAMQPSYEDQESEDRGYEQYDDDDEQMHEGSMDSSTTGALSASPTPPRAVLPDRNLILRTDQTMRTDQATAGSSQVAGASARRYINADELDRISMELEERRSERSMRSASRNSNSMSRSQSGASSPVSRSPSVLGSVTGSEHSIARSTRSNRHHAESVEDEMTARLPARATSPPTAQSPQPLRRHFSSSPQMQAGFRPPAPTPAHAVGDQLNPLLDVDESHVPLRAQAQTRRRQRSRGTALPSGAEPPEPTPFPQIRGEHLERLFFSAPEHNEKTCRVCRRRRRPESPSGTYGTQRPLWYHASKGRDLRARVEDAGDDDEGFAEGSEENAGLAKGKMPEGVARDLNFLKQDAAEGRLPPQTVLMRVLRELEDDFTHYKGIYTELADQYKLMDPASNVVKRNVLAEHLREVIDILEQKGDQIASLYDLLTFEDKPASQSVVPEKAKSQAGPSNVGRATGLKRHLAFA
ncbi:hypothetical protein EW146_g5788 [Bondarzewia mesenterica]|uniref:Cep57 centrosome microtubule-binding domain-containing protein n=1 Tax=Bondarzewia mesenterica TaxID=1095465 RepID=A0A4S4LR16_9AGAM|nr:hypothetical protein EW146_g5788 [Bondarzewia mesenterica]